MTDAAQFKELYQILWEEANNLWKFKLEKSLYNHHALQLFQTKKLSSSLEKYIFLNQSPTMKSKKLYEVMDNVMNKERDCQKVLNNSRKKGKITKFIIERGLKTFVSMVWGSPDIIGQLEKGRDPHSNP